MYEEKNIRWFMGTIFLAVIYNAAVINKHQPRGKKVYSKTVKQNKE